MTTTPQLDYIDAEARSILNNWVASFETDGTDLYTLGSEEGLHEAETFWETFQDNIEAAAAGAPADIFPDSYPGTDDLYTDEQMEENVRQMRLVHDLIAARVYQLLFCYDLTEEEL